MLKHCLSLKTFIPNFVAFFVSLAIVISCICKMSFSVTSAKREFTPAIASLSTSREVDNIPLISRVRGPYGKLWTEVFPSFYGPSAKRAGHENKEGKNENP